MNQTRNLTEEDHPFQWIRTDAVSCMRRAFDLGGHAPKGAGMLAVAMAVFFVVVCLVYACWVADE